MAQELPHAMDILNYHFWVWSSVIEDERI